MAKQTFAEFKLSKDIKFNGDVSLPLTGEIRWKTDNGYQENYWPPEELWSASDVGNGNNSNIFGIYSYTAKLHPEFLENIKKKFIPDPQNKAGIVNKTVFLIDTKEAKNWNPNNLADGKYDDSGELKVSVVKGKYYYSDKQNSQYLYGTGTTSQFGGTVVAWV